MIVLLDGGSIHKGPDVQTLKARCPRLHLEWFPGYAPELLRKLRRIRGAIEKPLDLYLHAPGESQLARWLLLFHCHSVRRTAIAQTRVKGRRGPT